jgi:hypothetical protein
MSTFRASPIDARRGGGLVQRGTSAYDGGVGTRWVRSSPVYLEEWLPRFVPYQLDLVRELGLQSTDRVWLPQAGPDIVPFARVVSHVRATEPNAALRLTCQRRLEQAGLQAQVVDAPATDTTGAPFDVVACAFGLRTIADRHAALVKWREAIAPKGKVALMTWGPAEPDDPQEWITQAAREVDPTLDFGRERIDTDRGALGFMMEAAGLTLVRHTIVRHNITFQSADAFVRAMRDASK